MHISNKCSIAVHCLIFIFEYGTEKKVTSELLSLSTGCNPVTIRNILSALKKDGIIRLAQHGSDISADRAERGWGSMYTDHFLNGCRIYSMADPIQRNFGKWNRKGGSSGS